MELNSMENYSICIQCICCFFSQPVELKEDDRKSLTMMQKGRVDNGLNDSSTGKCIFSDTKTIFNNNFVTSCTLYGHC